MSTADGRVTFRVPDLFEAALTLGGDEESDRWYLWAVRFLKPESASTYHSCACGLFGILNFSDRNQTLWSLTRCYTPSLSNSRIEYS